MFKLGQPQHIQKRAESKATCSPCYQTATQLAWTHIRRRDPGDSGRMVPDDDIGPTWKET